MTQSVEIGDPSLTGRDANQQIADAFSGATFPLSLTFTNRMPRPVVFPEVRGLELPNGSSADGASVTVEVRDLDTLQRVTSSIVQVAALNGYELAVSIAEPAAPEPERKPEPDPVPVPEPEHEPEREPERASKSAPFAPSGKYKAST